MVCKSFGINSKIFFGGNVMYSCPARGGSGTKSFNLPDTDRRIAVVLTENSYTLDFF